MAMKRTSLPVRELKPGMILAKDIIFEDKILLAKNMYLTNKTVKKLRANYYIDSVDVYLDGGKKSYDRFSNLQVEKARKFERTFNKFSSNLKDIFNNISKLKVPQMDPIRTFSEKIQKEFQSAGFVIKNIIFFGSKGDPVYRHSINVTAISYILGKWIGFDQTELNLLTYSALFHDFGKTKLDKGLLDKFPNITQREYETYKSHVLLGYDFIKQIPYVHSSVHYGLLMHHERMDGSGYPFGIKENKIHKFAKVIAIADLFDDISSGRYLKKVKGTLDVLQFIQEESLNLQLNSKYCDILLTHLVNYYMGETVILSNDKPCKIIQMSKTKLTKPLLLCDDKFIDLSIEKDLYVKQLVI